MTIAELRIGVLVAAGSAARALRLRTLESATRDHEPLTVDAAVAENFTRLVALLREAGRNPRVIGTLIAATALAHDARVATQDAAFDALPGVSVLHATLGRAGPATTLAASHPLRSGRMGT